MNCGQCKAAFSIIGLVGRNLLCLPPQVVDVYEDLVHPQDPEQFQPLYHPQGELRVSGI